MQHLSPSADAPFDNIVANTPEVKRAAVIGVGDRVAEVYHIIDDALGLVGEELDKSEVDSKCHHLAAHGGRLDICVAVVISLLPELLGS